MSVFFVCVAISFLLWLLTRMSDNVSSSLEYPVMVEDVPEGMILISQSDSIFNIRIDSRGWHLLALRRMRHSGDVKVSLKNIRMAQKGDMFYATIPTTGIEDRISHEMDVYNNMVSLTPDTLYLAFEKVVSKTIPVSPDISYTPEEQFFLYNPITSTPQFVTVFGAISDLQDIDTLRTEAWKEEKFRGSDDIRLKILFPNTRYPLKLSTDSVRVAIHLEQYTENVAHIPVTPVNTIGDREIKVFPKMTKIRYLVALRDYNSIENTDFRVEAVLKNSSLNKIPLNLAYSPDKCIIRSIDPESVEYIFIK